MVPIKYKILIVIAQYFIYFKTFTDNSEKHCYFQCSLKVLKLDTEQGKMVSQLHTNRLIQDIAKANSGNISAVSFANQGNQNIHKASTVIPIRKTAIFKNSCSSFHKMHLTYLSFYNKSLSICNILLFLNNPFYSYF